MFDGSRSLGVRLSSLALAGALAAGCGKSASSSAPADPADPASYQSPQGEKLSFGVQEGNLRNYFFRQGPVAVHLLTRSGTQPRIIAGFPAGNQGIGIWFDDAAAPGVDIQATGDIAAGGAVEGLVRPAAGARKAMRGIRATLSSGAQSLGVKVTLLANVRTLRDYGYGYDFTQAPELTDNQVELVAEHEVVRVTRQQIGGGHYMEYLLKGVEGTGVALNGGRISLSNPAGVKFQLIALSDDDPLTPIDVGALLQQTPAQSFELAALGFLTYREKLEAGSWRFLTYFGRDTLLAVRMLLPALQPEVVEAALSSVVERVNLVDGLADPYYPFSAEVGEVAHEEEIADYAAWKNSKEATPPADLRTPRHDYKMVDEDFLLAPVLVEYVATYPDRAAAFLTRARQLDGASYQAAVQGNLQLVLDSAAPYAASSRDPLTLVSLKSGVPVGDWRDSNEGLGFGRFAFDVNAALVPAALDAAGALYAHLGDTPKALEAQTLRAAWTDVDQHFLITVPQAEAQALVTAYANGVQLDPAPASEIDADLEYYGISLSADGAAVPIMHTDHGFVMLFTDPSDAYLQRVARSIARTFPAGLLSDVGIMVASPALAGEATVTNPLDGQSARLADIFTNSHYHGAVVWSWQQAMLAAGIRRQLERTDLMDDTVALLGQAECRIWQTIDKANQVRAGELWTWQAVNGKPEYRAFGYNLADVDESNAIQLWSTVYLVVKPPPGYPASCAVAPSLAVRPE